MTWDHPRGLAPLLAGAARWRAEAGVVVTWEARSLQDFESCPLAELAQRYDLIVIDHPHVGQVAGTGCLVPLDTMIDRAALEAIAAGSIGGSYQSYRWAERQWALPIDAAAQVQAWVPGRIDGPVHRLDRVACLLGEGMALIPLRAPHNLMTLFTLCGLNGVALDVHATALFPARAAAAYDQLCVFAGTMDEAAWSMDPIAVLEAMAAPSSRIAAAPFVYGYVSYAEAGFRPTRIGFADLPSPGPRPCGSALGGTGIAVSARSANVTAAVRHAAWIASGAVQRDLVGRAGGQPAHGAAWDDEGVNAAAGDFYRATRRTLDLAWLRPRHNGYMAFQEAASARLERALRGREPAADALAALNRLYEAHR